MYFTIAEIDKLYQKTRGYNKDNFIHVSEKHKVGSVLPNYKNVQILNVTYLLEEDGSSTAILPGGKRDIEPPVKDDNVE